MKKGQRWESAGLYMLKPLVNVVFALVWAVRPVFAGAERWRSVSVCSHLPEELGVVRSAEPGARVAAQSEDAIHGMS